MLINMDSEMVSSETGKFTDWTLVVWQDILCELCICFVRNPLLYLLVLFSTKQFNVALQSDISHVINNVQFPTSGKLPHLWVIPVS